MNGRKFVHKGCGILLNADPYEDSCRVRGVTTAGHLTGEYSVHGGGMGQWVVLRPNGDHVVTKATAQGAWNYVLDQVVHDVGRHNEELAAKALRAMRLQDAIAETLDAALDTPTTALDTA